MSPFRHPARAVLAAMVAALALPCSALATFPGHNGRIAFHATTATEGTQIFTIRPDGRDLHQITHVAGDAISVDWSPDGHRIAFEIDTEDSATVALMNADGSGVRTLPGIGLFNGDPSFTPDGERLVYGFFDGVHAGVASMRLDGSDPRLIQIADNSEDPNVSPDGTRISLTCQQIPDVLQTLCTIPAGGGPAPRPTPSPPKTGGPERPPPPAREPPCLPSSPPPPPSPSARPPPAAGRSRTSPRSRRPPKSARSPTGRPTAPNSSSPTTPTCPTPATQRTSRPSPPTAQASGCSPTSAAAKSTRSRAPTP